VDGVSSEVTGVEQRDGPRLGHVAQVGFETEIDNRTGGHADTKLTQGRASRRRFLKRRLSGRVGNMDEALTIIWKDNAFKGIGVGL